MSGLTEGCIPSEFHNTKRHAVEPQSGELEGAGGDMSQLIQHLDAAYNLARWLVRSEADAEDLVQEAYLRAVRSFHTLRRTESRPWMLAIVRNCCYDWLRRRGLSPLRKASAEEVDAFEADAPSPEAMVLQKEDAAAVRDALDRLPPHFQEVIILREFEQLPYKDIAGIVGVPLGTVMSRLSRARKQLEWSLGVRTATRTSSPPTRMQFGVKSYEYSSGYRRG